MIDQGFEQQCVLTSEHFDSESNELNRYGIHTVAGIMQNMPDSRKQVFVGRTRSEQVNNARIASVRSTVETFYGNQLASGAAAVAFSTKGQDSIRGDRAMNIDKMSFEGMQNPVIPITLGQSVTGAVGGN